MMKSVNTKIELMKNGDIDTITGCISETPEILQLNAILFGAKFKIINQEFINGIKNIIAVSKAAFFGVPMKKYAIAALDYLNVEKYEGNDELIKNLIKSNFNI